MNENHVVSLELAKQLKEAGYPQESEFYWMKGDGKYQMDGNDVFFVSTKEFQELQDMYMQEITGNDESNWEIICAAPLCTELLEQFNGAVEIDYLKGKIALGYRTKPNSALPDNIVYSDSLPDALAEMWLYLKKEKLL